MNGILASINQYLSKKQTTQKSLNFVPITDIFLISFQHKGKTVFSNGFYVRILIRKLGLCSKLFCDLAQIR